MSARDCCHGVRPGCGPKNHHPGFVGTPGRVSELPLVVCVGTRVLHGRRRLSFGNDPWQRHIECRWPA